MNVSIDFVFTVIAFGASGRTRFIDIINLCRQQCWCDATRRRLAWISTAAYYPKAKPGFARHAVKTSCMSFHQGTVTGLFSNPEASTIGK
jgi:hypothetical protein